MWCGTWWKMFNERQLYVRAACSSRFYVSMVPVNLLSCWAFGPPSDTNALPHEDLLNFSLATKFSSVSKQFHWLRVRVRPLSFPACHQYSQYPPYDCYRGAFRRVSSILQNWIYRSDRKSISTSKTHILIFLRTSDICVKKRIKLTAVSKSNLPEICSGDGDDEAKQDNSLHAGWRGAVCDWLKRGASL